MKGTGGGRGVVGPEVWTPLSSHWWVSPRLTRSRNKAQQTCGYFFTIWQYGWWQSQSESVLHKNVYFYSEIPCAVNTTSGECCRFPFKYKDVSYQDCTKADHHRPWCSLDPVFKGRWGDCGRCDLLFSLKNLKTPSSLDLKHTIPNSAFIGMGLWGSSNSLGFWYASPMSQGRGWGRGRQAG